MVQKFCKFHKFTPQHTKIEGWLLVQKKGERYKYDSKGEKRWRQNKNRV